MKNLTGAIYVLRFNVVFVVEHIYARNRIMAMILVAVVWLFLAENDSKPCWRNFK